MQCRNSSSSFCNKRPSLAALLKVLMLACIGLLLPACASFFDDPYDSSTQPDSEPVGGSASNPTTAPASSSSTTSQNQLVFTIARVEDLPANVNKVAFVHFADIGPSRDTDRELAMCKALIDTFEVTPKDRIQGSDNLIVWPVREQQAGDFCLDMLTKYEAISLAEKTARRIQGQAAGPFLLSRSGGGQIMIYDFSNLRRADLKNGLTGWQSVFSSDSATWPDYRYAR